MNRDVCEHAFQLITNKKHIYSAVMRVEKGDRTWAWEQSYGEAKEKARYFIASTTKLYVTNILLQLEAE